MWVRLLLEQGSALRKLRKHAETSVEIFKKVDLSHAYIFQCRICAVPVPFLCQVQNIRTERAAKQSLQTKSTEPADRSCNRAYGQSLRDCLFRFFMCLSPTF
jgi:hypothetical protein